MANVVGLLHSRLHSGQAEDWTQVRLEVSCYSLFPLLASVVGLKHSRVHAGQAKDGAQVGLNVLLIFYVFLF
jgi:hypothetical protein